MERKYIDLKKNLLELIQRTDLSRKYNTLYLLNSLPNIFSQSNNSLERELHSFYSQYTSNEIFEMLWDLVNKGILYLDFNQMNSYHHWFFNLTLYGRSYIENTDEITPYDPDCIFEYLNNNISELDQALKFYLGESLRTFNNGYFLSSIISLGIASEKAVRMLSDKYCEALNRSGYSTRKSQIESKYEINKIFQALQQDYNKITTKDKSYFEYTLQEKIKTQVFSIYNLIRLSRNEAGHPKEIIDIDRLDAYSNLIIFPKYLITIYEIINTLDTKPLPTGLNL